MAVRLRDLLQQRPLPETCDKNSNSLAKMVTGCSTTNQLKPFGSVLKHMTTRGAATVNGPVPNHFYFKAYSK